MRTSIALHLHEDTDIVIRDHHTPVSGNFTVLKLFNAAAGDLCLYPGSRKELVRLRNEITKYLETTEDEG